MKITISKSNWLKLANQDLKYKLQGFDVFGIQQSGNTSVVLINDPLLSDFHFNTLSKLNAKLGFDKKTNKFILFIK